MSKPTENTWMPLLEGLGFTPESHQTWRLWRLDTPGEASSMGRIELPWRIQSFELSERKGQLSVSKLALSLSKTFVVRNLQNLVRKYYGPRTHADLVRGRDGDLWCVFEFTRPGTREKSAARVQTGGGALLPHGVGGFNLRFGVSGSHISILVSDYFGFGYLPNNFAAVPQRLVGEALGFRQLAKLSDAAVSVESIYEMRIAAVDPMLLQLSLSSSSKNTAKDTVNVEDNTNAFLTNLVELRRQLLRPRAGMQITASGDAETLFFQTSTEGDHELAVPRSGSPTPLEVLEARERSALGTSIDTLILAGKLNKASQLCLDRWAAGDHDLHLMRRLALLGLSGRQTEQLDFLPHALDREDGFKLFLSCGVNRALEDGDQRRVLALLSRLGAEVMASVPGADQLPSFDVVLPELLGDAWGAEDRRKAEECYQRIIQRRGDLPRILRKLINLARLGGRSEQEASYLSRLATVERRRAELAKINLRLAELRRATPAARDQACELALRALHLDRTNDRAALLAAEILVEQGNPEEAIELIDGVLKDGTVNLASKAKSRLYAMIAGIWSGVMDRPDLAESRYEQAIHYDRGNLGALKELEAIYRRHERIRGLGDVLETQFEYYERYGDGQALRQVFDELVSLYRGVLSQPKRAYELYQRVLASVTVEPEEIDRVLAWRDVEINWRDLYDRLNAKLADAVSGEWRGRYLCRLADIARGKLDETSLAVRHLLEALSENWIDPGSFRFLCEYLCDRRDFSTLARCYERRIEQVGEVERQRLMLELLAVPDVLTDVRRDQLAVQAYMLDTQNEKIIHHRLRYYQSTDDIHGIERLIESLFEQKELGKLQRSFWLKAANDVLESCIDEQKFALLDRNFRSLVDIDTDLQETLQSAIAALEKSPEPSRLVFYIVKLLEEELIPPLEERFLLKLLSGLDRELALYHQLRSLKSIEPETAASHARTAAALYSKRPDQEQSTEKMLGRLCVLVPCSDDDLMQLAHLVEVTGNYDILAKALQKQAELEDVPGRRLFLLERLGHVYWHQLKDHARARLAYRTAMKHASPAHKIKLILAKIAADIADDSQERHALIDYLLDPAAAAAAADELQEVAYAIRRLKTLGEDDKHLVRLLQSHIDRALAADSLQLAGDLARTLIECGIVSAELYKLVFHAALAVKNQEQVADAFWRGLTCVSDKDKAKAYLAEMRSPLERAGLHDWLHLCFQETLAHNASERLGPKTKREILIQYGQLLFETDTERQKALVLFQEAFHYDHEDNRTWIPLYFLYLEFGTVMQRLEHLRQIVSKLAFDPRPLKSFPLTIESLQAELQELEELEGVAAEADAEGKLDDVVSDQGLLETEMQQVGGEAAGFSLAPVQAWQSGGDYEPSALHMVPQPPAMESEAANQNQDAASPLAIEFDSSFEPIPAPFGEIEKADHEAVPALVDALVHPIELLTPEDSPSCSAQAEASDAALDLGFVPELPAELSEDFAPVLLKSKTDEDTGGEFVVNLDLNAHSSEDPITPVSIALPDVGSCEPDIPDLVEENRVLDLGHGPLEDHNLDGAPLDLADGDSGIAMKLADDKFPSRLPPLPEHKLSEGPDSEAGDDVDEVVGIHFELKRPSDNVVPPPPLEGEAPLDDDLTSLEILSDTGDYSETSVIGQTGETFFTPEPEQEGDIADWRAAVLKGDFNVDLTTRLFTQAFASEIEKHLALQAVALVAGNCHQLNNWHWRVWRRPDEYGYPTNGKARFSQTLSSPALHSSLHKLVIAMGPLLVKMFRSRFTLEHIAQRLEMSPIQIEKLRKEMSWQSGILCDVGFGRFYDRIAERGYRAFNLPGLGSEIFYDGASRCIYLDEAHYRKAPSSHLFHRILHILWSVRIHYYVPLALNPSKQFIPALQDLHQYFGTRGLARIASRLSPKSMLAKHLSGMDTRQIRSLYEKVGMPSEDTVLQLWEAMRVHVLRLAIAETLDVIGVFEAITNRDLLKPIKHSEIFELSAHAKGLLDFVTKLEI